LIPITNMQIVLASVKVRIIRLDIPAWLQACNRYNARGTEIVLPIIFPGWINYTMLRVNLYEIEYAKKTSHRRCEVFG
jgi:hypothetical protein